MDSILEAVLTVSPNKQYRGIFKPTTPATTIPVCTPTCKEWKKIKENAIGILFVYNYSKNGSVIVNTFYNLQVGRQTHIITMYCVASLNGKNISSILV